MKKYMMIVGAKIIQSNKENPDMSIVELYLLQLTNVKQDMNLAEASSMSFLKLGNLVNKLEMHKMEQEQDRVIITLGEWRDRGYKIGKHVSLELLPDDTTGGV